MQNSQGRTVIVKGRIIWTSGDLFKGEPRTDMNTKQPKLDSQGNQQIQYGFGLAVKKEDLAQMGQGQPGEIWAAIHQEAQALYPNAQIPPSFAFKYKDGDTAVDQQGQPYSKRQGYAGCIVFTLTTNIPIKFFRYEAGVGNVMVSDGIKCGDYVNVQVSIKAHGTVPGTQSKPGMYLNPMLVQLWQTGEPIINTPDANAVFGGAAPAGMNYSGPAVPPQAQMGAQFPGTPQAPMPGPAAAPQMAAPAPNYGVIPPQHQPQQPMAAPQPPSFGGPVGAPAMPQYGQPPMPGPVAPQFPAQPGMPAIPGFPQPQ